MVQELMEQVGPEPRALQPLPARVLRRPAPAHRRRPRARAEAEAHRRRRAGLRARRLDPGADHQPAARPAARPRPHDHLHRPRPQRRAPHVRPRRGDVPRQDRRARDRPTSSSTHPRHPYTGALLTAVPVADPAAREGARRGRCSAATCRRRPHPPPGCRFHTRCPRRRRSAADDEPPLEPKDGGNARRLPLPAQQRGRGEDGPDRRRMSTPAGATDRVVAALRAAGVEPDIHEFPQGTRTSQDAADAVGCDVAQIAKSIVFRLDRDGEEPEALLVITSGPNRVDVGEGRRARRAARCRRPTRRSCASTRASRSAGCPPSRTRGRSRS